MTVQETIIKMETLWDDLCRNSQIDSPDWHKDILLSRDGMRNNKQKPIDWKRAKKEIYSKIK